jgi:hypothetical protein
MNFVKANALNRTGLAVGKDHGLAYKPGLGSLDSPRIVHACCFTAGMMVFHKREDR